MKEPSPYFAHRPAQIAAENPGYAAFRAADTVRVDLWEYWRTIRKHLWLVLSVPLVLVALVGLRDLMATPLYTAEAMILIKNAVPEVFEDTSVSGAGNGKTDSAWDVSYKTEYRLLRARSLAARVIMSQNLAASPAFTRARKLPKLASDAGAPGHANITIADPPGQQVPPALINRYLADLKVTPISDTELVKVSFTTPQPDLSARLANAHIREFVSQGTELNAQASTEAERFLRKKLGELKRQLEESELALNNYRRDKGIIPGLISVNGSEDVVLGRLDRLSQQVQSAHLKSINLATKVALIKQGEAGALPAVIESTIVQQLKGQLDALETKYAAMSGQYRPNYLPMAELTAKIKATRRALRKEIDSIVASIKEEYSASVQDEATLDHELQHQKKFALGLNDAAVKYSILQREADTNRQLYNAVLKRMKDVEITGDLHASNVSIVDTATPPLHPSSPRKARDLLAAALLGLMGGVCLSFLLDRQDNTFRDTEDIERYLRVPQLSMVPDFQRNGVAYASRKLRTSTRPELPAAYRKEIVISPGVQSPASESFRKLRTALLLSRPAASPKTVIITSAVAKEGKTTVSANLAIALAGTRKRVVLVDGDLRRPYCHHLFAIKNSLGLTEALTGAREPHELVRETAVRNLFLLSAGEMPPDPSELLGSDKMREILASLSASYDFVVIDSAPVLPVADTTVFTHMVDGVILVVGKDTARQRVKSGLSLLEYVGAKVFGVVLNRADPHTTAYHDYGYEYRQVVGHNGDPLTGPTS